MKTTTFLLAGLALGMTLAAPPVVAGGDVTYGAGLVKHRVPAAVPVPAPAPVPDIASGYYLRLDAGYNINSIDKYNDPDARFDSVRADDGLANFSRYEIGAGYYFSRWFRGDVTVGTRSEVRSKGQGNIDFSGPVDASGHTIQMRDTVYDRFRSTNYTAMVNGYLDVPINQRFTPYVGAGVGFVMHTSFGRQIQRNVNCVDTVNCDPSKDGTLANPFNPNFTGLNYAAGTGTTAGGAKQRYTELAWAIMSGFSYQVAESLKLDVGYRMLHLDGVTWTTPWQLATPAKLTVPGQNNHEMRVGVRYDIN